MREITRKQSKVLEFIRKQQGAGRSPSLREIAKYMATSLTAAADHVRALKRKGCLKASDRTARSLQIVSPLQNLRKPVMEVPLFRAIPQGNGVMTPKACVCVDAGSIGIRSASRAFAVEVRDDSLIGRHLVPGDRVICDRGLAPKPGDIVAALVGKQSTLKTYVTERGKPYLKSEGPTPARGMPAEQASIQGVVVGLIRSRRGLAEL